MTRAPKALLGAAGATLGHRDGIGIADLADAACGILQPGDKAEAIIKAFAAIADAIAAFI